MLWYVVLGSLVAAGVVGAIIAFLLRYSELRPAIWLVWIFGLAALAGVVLVVVSAEEVAHEFQRRRWPSTIGTVIESDLVGERAFHAVIIYEYTHNDRTCIDTCSLYQPSFGGKRRRHEVAKRTLAPYYPGAEVAVYLDPNDPTDSTLDISVHWAAFGQVGFGAALFMVGVGLILLRRFSRS